MMHVRIPFFPPTTNHAYFTRGHVRVLTKVGKKFKAEVKNFLGREHPDFLSYFRPNTEYEVLFLLFFGADSLYNRGWPKDPEMSRHKSIDASNRVKLLEDAVVEAAGYNDAQHFAISVVKTEALLGQEPYVEMWAWNEEDNGPIARFITTRTV